MPKKTALVTGSSGLIGSEAVSFLDERGWTVHGVDNNAGFRCQVTAALAGALPVMRTANSAQPTAARRLIHENGRKPARTALTPKVEVGTRRMCGACPRLAAYRFCTANASNPLSRWESGGSQRTASNQIGTARLPMANLA